MKRHPLSALLLLIAAWTQVLAPMVVTCAAMTVDRATALDQTPICHGGTPTADDEGAPAAPAGHTCVLCLTCHALGGGFAPAAVLAAPLRIAAAPSWRLPADAALRREAFTRARARSPPVLV